MGEYFLFFLPFGAKVIIRKIVVYYSILVKGEKVKISVSYCNLGMINISLFGLFYFSIAFVEKLCVSFALLTFICYLEERF